MSEWQPIKTAPKDGTIIIGLRKDDEHICESIQWDDNFELPHRWRFFGGRAHADYYSHWMPLPSLSGEQQLEKIIDRMRVPFPEDDSE